MTVDASSKQEPSPYPPYVDFDTQIILFYLHIYMTTKPLRSKNESIHSCLMYPKIKLVSQFLL